MTAVKARIKTVANIQKITKAMKMVAASKLRQVEAKLNDARIFQVCISGVVKWITVPSECVGGCHLVMEWFVDGTRLETRVSG